MTSSTHKPGAGPEIEDMFADVDPNTAPEKPPGDRRPQVKPLAGPPKRVLPVAQATPQKKVQADKEEVVYRKSFFKRPAGILLIVMVGIVILATIGMLVVSYFMPSQGTVVSENENSNSNNAFAGQNTNDEPISNVNELQPLSNLNDEIDTNINTNSDIDTGPVIDTDKDGLDNATEDEYGTDPKSYDTDHDGLTDREEIIVYLTDPLNPDTDGDGYSDGDEVANLFNPNGEGELLNLNSAIKNLNTN